MRSQSFRDQLPAGKFNMVGEASGGHELNMPGRRLGHHWNRGRFAPKPSPGRSRSSVSARLAAELTDPPCAVGQIDADVQLVPADQDWQLLLDQGQRVII